MNKERQSWQAVAAIGAVLAALVTVLVVLFHTEQRIYRLFCKLDRQLTPKRKNDPFKLDFQSENFS